MILIVGATGLLGGMIARQLLQQRQPVRILVRPNSASEQMAQQGMATSAASLAEAGARLVYGDLKDRASLDKACEGVDTVITTANSVLRGGEDTLESVDIAGTRNLIDAAQAAGVQHFIYTSAAGSDVNHPVPLFRAKGQSEAYLKASGMSYTNLLPGVFMEVWIGVVVGTPLRAGQPVTLVGQGAAKVAFVSMADVAAYAVTSIDHPAAKNADIYIGGPQAYSWTEAVEAVGRAIGQPLPIAYVPPDAPVPLIRESMAQMMAGMELGDSVIPMVETAKVFGVVPTSLDVFAGRMFGT